LDIEHTKKLKQKQIHPEEEPFKGMHGGSNKFYSDHLTYYDVYIKSKKRKKGRHCNAQIDHDQPMKLGNTTSKWKLDLIGRQYKHHMEPAKEKARKDDNIIGKTR
jgi:hypothetical protein